jgi:hypothetical protein
MRVHRLVTMLVVIAVAGLLLPTGLSRPEDYFGADATGSAAERSKPASPTAIGLYPHGGW